MPTIQFINILFADYSIKAKDYITVSSSTNISLGQATYNGASVRFNNASISGYSNIYLYIRIKESASKNFINADQLNCQTNNGGIVPTVTMPNDKQITINIRNSNLKTDSWQIQGLQMDDIEPPKTALEYDIEHCKLYQTTGGEREELTAAEIPSNTQLKVSAIADEGYYFMLIPSAKVYNDEYPDGRIYEGVEWPTMTGRRYWIFNDIVLNASKIEFTCKAIDETNVISFSRSYLPTIDELNQLAHLRWIQQAVPLQAVDGGIYIQSLNVLPLLPPSIGRNKIRLGPVQTDVLSDVAAVMPVDLNCGSVNVDIDCPSLTLYLPFIGNQSIDAEIYRGKALSLKYTVDVQTGNCIASLSIDDCVVQTFSGNCAQTVSLRTMDNSLGGIDTTYNFMMDRIPKLIETPVFAFDDVVIEGATKDENELIHQLLHAGVTL